MSALGLSGAGRPRYNATARPAVGSLRLVPAEVALDSADVIGREWLVEAHGCRPEALADLAVLRELFARMVRELGLHPMADPLWHQFPEPAGITGLCLLAESHLAVHTFPEHGSLCLNLFCCRPRPEWDYAAALAELVGADRVEVRSVERPYAGVGASV